MNSIELIVENNRILWWKDKKLLVGITIVVLSFIIGTYGKVLSIARFYEPVQLLTGLSLYAFSWLMLFLGAFLVGWETIKMANYKIHHHIKKTAKKTYHHAKGFPRKSYDYTKNLKNRWKGKGKND
jgi:uncharacterized membrane protein YcjF (UPF0283 family)